MSEGLKGRRTLVQYFEWNVSYDSLQLSVLTFCGGCIREVVQFVVVVKVPFDFSGPLQYSVCISLLCENEFVFCVVCVWVYSLYTNSRNVASDCSVKGEAAGSFVGCGFTMSLHVADMVGGVRMLVVDGGMDGSWAGYVRWDGFGAVCEGMGTALMVSEVEVLG